MVAVARGSRVALSWANLLTAEIRDPGPRPG